MNWLTIINELKLPSLQKGAHENPSLGLCAMEMVAFIERLPHSDTPNCTCPVIGAYVRALNDSMTDLERQQLLSYLPRLVGTVSKAHEIERATLAAWRAVKVFAPLALEKNWPEMAKLLREFDETKGLKAAAEAARAAYVANAASAAAHAADAADAAYAAAYAADAAAYAANAAHAAAAAADAAYAANAAHAAAHAAYAAVYAAREPCIKAALRLLDDMLAIGPKGSWSKDIIQQVKELSELAT